MSPRLGKPVQKTLHEMWQVFPPLRNYLGNSPKYYPMWFARHDTHLSSKHRILPWWYDYFWRGFSEVRIELFKSVKIDRLNNRLNQTDYPLGTYVFRNCKKNRQLKDPRINILAKFRRATFNTYRKFKLQNKKCNNRRTHCPQTFNCFY